MTDYNNKVDIDRLTSLYRSRGLETFEFEWEGTSIPRTIKLSNGLEKSVGQMRNGSILFGDCTSAVYEVLETASSKQAHRILVGYFPLMHQPKPGVK